jgi:hypothetical protein
MERQMAIRAVSRQDFDRFGASGVTLTPVTGQAVEWFADDSGDRSACWRVAQLIANGLV